MPTARYTKADWIALGLAELKTGGPPALTIDALCAAAGKTRGSFYFHFESIDAFTKALAEEWKETFTSIIIASVTSSNGRQDLLNLLAVRLDLPLESGIRKLAQSNQNTEAIVADADEKRIDWLSQLYEDTGTYTSEEADNLAHIEYAAFIGFKLVKPAMSPAQSRDLYTSFLRLTNRS